MRIVDPLPDRSSHRLCSWLVVGVLGTVVCVGFWCWLWDDAGSSISAPTVPKRLVLNMPATASVVEVSAPGLEVPSERQPIPFIAGSPAPQADFRVDPAKADPRAEMIIAHVNELARTQPARALRMLVEIPESPERDAALVHVTSQWAGVEPQAATAWMAEMAPGPLREQMCVAVATARAERDPRGAAEFVATQISESVHLRNAAVAVAQRWVQSDGPAAMRWVAEFPQADVRRMAMDATLRVWTATDAGGLARWARDLPEDSVSEEIRGVLSAVDVPKQ
jgi:hypothetical protein